MIVTGGPSELTIRAAGGTAPPHNITLDGEITGAGGFAKTGGMIAIDLGAANQRLAISGTFTRSGTCTFPFNFSSILPLQTGIPRTLISFGSSSGFTADDFSFTGLGYASGHFTLTPNSLLFTLDDDGSAKSPFYGWLVANNLPPSDSEATNDAEHDGVVNLLEFAAVHAPPRDPALTPMMTLPLRGPRP